MKLHGDSPTLPPVRLTISKGDQTVVIRVSDQGKMLPGILGGVGVVLYLAVESCQSEMVGHHQVFQPIN